MSHLEVEAAKAARAADAPGPGAPAARPAPARAEPSARVPDARPALLRGLPREFWLLWAGMFVNRLGGAVFPFLALYLTRERGLDAGIAGLVVGLYAAGGAPGAARQSRLTGAWELPG